MNQRDLKKQIKSSKISNLYIFCGDDYFLKQLYVERIAKAKDMMIEKTYAENEEELKEVNLKALSGGLFDSKRKLIYCYIDFKLTKKISFKEPKNNVFVVDSLDCNINFSNTFIFERPSSKEIQEFLLYKANMNKKIIEPKALEFLVDLFSGKDTTFINNSFDVVLLFCHNKDPITLEDVEQSVFETSKFYTKDLFKFLNKGNLKGLLDKIDNILNQIHPSLFVHLLSDNFIKIYVACDCDENCFSQIFKGYYSSFKRLCDRFGKKKVKHMLGDLYFLDRAVKSSGLEGVETLIKAKMVEWVA